MRIRLCAVGRMRRGPEAQLTRDYLERFDRTGRSLGLGPAEVIEVEARDGRGRTAEARLLRRAIPSGARIMAMDGCGREITSPDLASLLARHRDDGCACLAILLGGADGLHPDLLADARDRVSMGRLVWPHLLARAMVAEQLYRAASILAGAPYHRA